MATASIALQFDYLANPKWALQGFEVLEQEAILEEEETQMESGNSNYNIVEVSSREYFNFCPRTSCNRLLPSVLQKTKLVGTLLNLYQTTTTETQHQLLINQNLQQQQLSNSTLGFEAPGNPPRIGQNQSNDFGHYMEYVDSPPDSKEAWPNEYMKSEFIIFLLYFYLLHIVYTCRPSGPWFWWNGTRLENFPSHF